MKKTRSIRPNTFYAAYFADKVLNDKKQADRIVQRNQEKISRIHSAGVKQINILAQLGVYNEIDVMKNKF